MVGIATVANRGKVVTLEHRSQVLRGNALRDPRDRQLHVYTPPGYGDGRAYPVVFLLSGYGSRGVSQLNWSAWQEGLPEQLDRLIHAGTLPPCLVALPDCFTRLGGCQYVNSPAQGRYLDYLCDELVPLVDSKFETLGDGARAIAGKSSGGIGALWTCIERPGLFSACASQSGDSAFELFMPPEFLRAAIELKRQGGLPAYWRKVRAGAQPNWSSFPLAIVLACAAAYSPSSRTPWGFDLPFDPETGEIRQAVFARWLKFDPVHAAAARPAGLRALRALHLDAGDADEYGLQFGAEQLSRVLKRLGIRHRHQEFAGTHRETRHRWDVSLPFLVKALPRARKLR